jgi:methyl-accepting chemotaxis protein
MLILIAASIISSILLSYFIIKSITHPLDEAIGAVNRISTGDTHDMKIVVVGQDESSQLMMAVERMWNSNNKMCSVLSSVASGRLLAIWLLD